MSTLLSPLEFNLTALPYQDLLGLEEGEKAALFTNSAWIATNSCGNFTTSVDEVYHETYHQAIAHVYHSYKDDFNELHVHSDPDDMSAMYSDCTDIKDAILHELISYCEASPMADDPEDMIKALKSNEDDFREALLDIKQFLEATKLITRQLA